MRAKRGTTTRHLAPPWAVPRLRSVAIGGVRAGTAAARAATAGAIAAMAAVEPELAVRPG